MVFKHLTRQTSFTPTYVVSHIDLSLKNSYLSYDSNMHGGTQFTSNCLYSCLQCHASVLQNESKFLFAWKRNIGVCFVYFASERTSRFQMQNERGAKQNKILKSEAKYPHVSALSESMFVIVFMSLSVSVLVSILCVFSKFTFVLTFTFFFMFVLMFMQHFAQHVHAVYFCSKFTQHGHAAWTWSMNT